MRRSNLCFRGRRRAARCFQKLPLQAVIEMGVGEIRKMVRFEGFEVRLLIDSNKK